MARFSASLRFAAAAIAAWAWLWPVVSPAKAEDQPVDLELVLAVDISLSMDRVEQQVQRQGYVDAMRHPEVIGAIRSGLHGRIAVTYAEWAGTGTLVVVVPWTLIDGEAAAQGFSRYLAASPMRGARRTSISDAIDQAGALFGGNGFSGIRRVIDISGDGPNNQGVPVTAARGRIVARGITINGLPVQLDEGRPASLFSIADLDVYYEDCVIGGPGAFIVPVRSVEEFAIAVRRKLVLEIAGLPARLIRAQFGERPPRADCLIGEKLWREWMDGGGYWRE
ncbi:MAG TPA: DUF1194 domain-containing protein [Hyphomicrobiales bacterium]|nr:DUF1194 domain-containing protein [Hyphomicrobiales bacterium]